MKEYNEPSKRLKRNSEINMAKQRITTGSILEINIDGQYHTYAQILQNGRGIAFFDFKSEERLIDFSTLEKCNLLFIVVVYNDVITQGKWLKGGKLPIRKELEILPRKFIQDNLNPSEFRLYNPNTGEITKATREQCEGLECAAVWEANHVEDRIRDHYLGVPNIWVEQLKMK
jgi:hypothetical protein